MTDKPEIKVVYELAFVPLTKGGCAIIGADDVHIVCGFKWYACKRRNVTYATSKNRFGKTVYMHRLLMKPGSAQVDHISGDGLDNRRSNLRLATHAENAANEGLRANNKSGAKGVGWHGQRRKWYARIRANGCRYNLGLFNTLEEAKAAYEAASKQLHGSFGRVA